MEPHFVSLYGNEIYIFKNKTDTHHKQMYSLTSCFIKTDPEDSTPISVDSMMYYPISIAVPPSKITVVYFDSTQ